MKGEFTTVFEKRAGWYVAYIEEVPGANTQGKTLKEARENLKEAVILVLEANRTLAEKSQTRAKLRKEILTVELSRDVA
jgi:predicted RNase H-like HicB family nuclease